MHLQTSESALTFAVQDSGIGIPKNDMPRWFEKFYRGTNREALAERGNGLGPASVKSIAVRHGGKVWAESDWAREVFSTCKFHFHNQKNLSAFNETNQRIIQKPHY